ncbi:unnamed protein product [Gongylonema pulchrum]|uniref:C-type lectin domain-containing protein n=1 Tax=Gongylonema pulchrum TaxID=637853 RepID=A0A183EKG4_9BILA|nr:unnamed protein product [Gongylonema pulchrum]
MQQSMEFHLPDASPFTAPCGNDPLYCPLRTRQGTVCYHLLTRLHYWEQASEVCDAQYQSDLSSMHSRDEIDFIYQMVLLQPTVSGETKYWIGLHRRNVHGQYEWSDGSAFDYMVQTVVNEDPDEEAGACTAIKFNVSTRSLLSSSLYYKMGIPPPPQKSAPGILSCFSPIKTLNDSAGLLALLMKFEEQGKLKNSVFFSKKSWMNFSTL